MKFEPTPLAGAWVVGTRRHADDRGYFARMFCEREFGEKGLERAFVQANDSFNVEAGTLRGMHFQLPPSAEVKMVSCVQGALWDVILDLRPSSPTYLASFGIELSQANGTMLYVPRGFAHGFITLEPNTHAIYLASAHYAPDRERGVRFDDARFAIDWPIEPRVISDKDRSWPDFDPDRLGVAALDAVDSSDDGE